MSRHTKEQTDYEDQTDNRHMMNEMSRVSYIFRQLFLFSLLSDLAQ